MNIKLIVLIAVFGGIALAGNPVTVHAQQLVCGIYYDYDAAGLRVKRYYDCKDPYAADPGTFPGGGIIGGKMLPPRSNRADSVGVKVYPNPTRSQLFIRIPKSGTHTHFHIYGSSGLLVYSGSIENEVYECDLTRFAPGTYIVKVYYQEESYMFPITKQ